MKDAELVTFGGSALDRAAELRGDAAKLKDLWTSKDGGTLPLWRGKPLFDGPDRNPVWLDADHPVIAAGGPPIFLGLDDGAPRFAVDVSSWEPDELAETIGGLFDASEQHHPDLPGEYVFAELRAAMTALSPRRAELLATARAIWDGIRRTSSAPGAVKSRTWLWGAGNATARPAVVITFRAPIRL